MLPLRTNTLTRIFALGLMSAPLLVACGEESPTDGPGDGTAGSTAGVGVGGQATTAGAATGGAAQGGAGVAGGVATAGAAGSIQAGAGGSTGGGGNTGGVSSGGTAGNGTSGAGGSAGQSGGAGGSGGSAGSGGSGGGSAGGSSTGDCNSVTGQTVITVAKSGATFSTVQAALNSLSKTNTTPTQIRIAPGTYEEKLVVQVPNITLCGQTGKASSTILTYKDNANTSNGNGGTIGTTGSASTNITANDVSAENITFANSTPLGGSQAVALLVSGNQVQFRGCRFLSYQDTLYVRKQKQYFRDCYVEGSVDFIFGDGTTVFENCTVHSAAGGTAVTAPNTDQAVAYGLVFLGGKLTSSQGSATTVLGRNWGAYGSATFLRTDLGAHIKPVGWQAMGENTLDTARFAEYKTTGAGASSLGSRAKQSKQLSDAEAGNYTLAKIFGSWVPSFSK